MAMGQCHVIIAALGLHDHYGALTGFLRIALPTALLLELGEEQV
jgi:hypothetical protein